MDVLLRAHGCRLSLKAEQQAQSLAERTQRKSPACLHGQGFKVCRDGKIRTCDLLVPNQAR